MPALPESVEYCVIGGGVHGLSTAWHLAGLLKAKGRNERNILLLDKKAPGAFNLAGDGTMTWRETADVVGLKTRELSMKAAKRLGGIMWRLRVPKTESPPGNADFIRYPWVVSTEKLKAETGWSPQYTSRAAFEDAMRAKGKLAAAPEATPVPAT